uniref:hypothetical protein n=1 Tax=Stenotrophomonas maltophilia TaxID=40324 RepID=UPI0013DD0C4A
GKDDPSALSDLHVLELLLIDRQTDLARDFATLRGIELLDENLLQAIAQETGFEEVASFLKARRISKSQMAERDDPNLLELVEASAEDIAQT